MPKYQIQLVVEFPGENIPRDISIGEKLHIYSTANGQTEDIWAKITSVGPVKNITGYELKEDRGKCRHGRPECECVKPPVKGGENTDLEEIAQRLNAYAAENFDKPEWRRDIAEEITETIWLGVEHESILPRVLQVKNAAFNERVTVMEPKGMKAWFLAQGGAATESSGMYTNVIEVPRVTSVIHVYEFEDKLRTNFAETQATLVELGVQRLEASEYMWAYSTICSAIPSTSPYYYSAHVPLEVVDQSISEVRDLARDFECVILGREPVVNLFKNSKNFLPEINDDMLRRGSVGTYWGAPVLALRNYVDSDGEPFFPANEFIILGKDAAKWVNFGSPITHEWLDPQAGEWHYLMRRDVGFIVHHPERIRRIAVPWMYAFPEAK